ncbi:ABC transporter ATP-binding protein [Neisseriaceae bacterium JH1-16]|nr:ABC transporter ATP-binding protein [Neisseriaceae bacterium JH1-16]
MIRLEQLTKRFAQKHGQSVTVVDSVDLQVARGEICVLLGASGCGKTTTLKMINRLITPSEGRVLIDGADTRDIDTVTLRRRIGYVIQQIGLFPNMTIEDNITVVPRLLGLDKAAYRNRARELMALVQMDPAHFLKRYPKELSGGQQQRIGVIRALAADPPVLLMDEPFGAVDPINRESIQAEFFALQRELNTTVLMVSHDIDEAIKLGDKVAVFRQGRIVQCASPDTVLAEPADDFVASFVGHDRILKRLLLVQAGSLAEQGGEPVLSEAASEAEQRAALGERRHRALPVIDAAGRAQGYVATGRAGLQPFRAIARADEDLRVVLARLYEHRLDWLPVLDADQRYLGRVSQRQIADYLGAPV